MKNNITRAMKKFYSISLEHRIFVVIAVIGIIFSFFTAIMNIVLDIGIIPVLASLIMGVFTVIILVLSIYQKKYKVYALITLIILTFILYPSIWILSGGSKGTIPYFFILNMIFIPFVLNGKARNILIVSNLIIIIFLLILEILSPDIIIPYETDIQRMLDISFILVLLCISAFKLAFILVKEYNQKIDSLKSTQDKLAHLSITDELTKIYNRRYLTDELKKLIDYKVEFTVIMIDIDNFKNINDTYGHSVGDMVLIEISKNLKKKLEPNQILGRIGGEEFLIISKEKYSEKTYHFAEFIRLSTEEIIYPNIEFPVTISLGVCSSKSSTKLDDILIEADRCLYRAKEEGKNKVICYNNDF